jgi:asparagine synthase (glutamine-hydrolysing)
MCGFAGLLHCGRTFPTYSLEDTARRMAHALRHRGPDDSGVWVGRDAGIALGHRRLAILDLSHEGHQPMVSACGRFVVAFNGEIYNYKDIRSDVESTGRGPAWRGHSDTEVLLAAVSTWGVERAVRRFSGMFAFALWDQSEHTLYLARDRIGEKPLYYGWVDDSFVFGSGLAAFRNHPSWRGEVDRDSVALLLRFGCIPAPASIHVGISKLAPGTILTLTRAQAIHRPGVLPEPRAYWSALEAATLGMREPFRGDVTEATQALEALLSRAVREQMVADVPLGAFLSGGVDSSAVVALMQSQSARTVKTFSIGFYEESFNEARYAKSVAEHLETDHTEVYITPEHALSVIPKLPEIYDEPFADSSQIPTVLVAQLARSQVTVSLSGDGGDEVFGGYNRYFVGRRIWDAMRRVPLPIRARPSRFMRGLSAAFLDRAVSLANLLLPRRVAQTGAVDKFLKLAEILDAPSLVEMYGRLISHWRHAESIVLGTSGRPGLSWPGRRDNVDTPDAFAQMMFLDLVAYLPDDILVKVDRATMAVGLESRMPLLDHRVVEFAWTLPGKWKVRKQEGKWLLRQVLYKHVPRRLIERPKSGFEVPIGAWLRGPLREWTEGLLQESRLKAEGFFDPAPIVKKWREHLSGRHNWQHYLWDVLMFQAWLEKQSRP